MIVCPRCGKENQDHYKFCLGCGAELPRDAAHAPKSFTAPTPPAGFQGGGAVSPAAGFGAPPGGARPQSGYGAPAAPAAPFPGSPAPGGFGAPVGGGYSPAPQAPAPQAPQAPVSSPAPAAAPVADTVTCGKCGSPNNRTFKFCGTCGHSLQASAPAMAAAPAAPSFPQDSGFGAPATQRGSLVLIRPDGSEGESFPLGATTVIGREAGGLFASDSYLSPRHATFTFGPHGLSVRDEGSLNGVYVRIAADSPVELRDGSIFRIGQEILRFERLKAAPPEDGVEIMGSPSAGLIGRICLIIGRETTGNCYAIPAGGLHLGRERGDILFPDDGYVSGLHCRLHEEGGRMMLTDVGSSNGSFVRLDGEGQLASGALILMGQQLFRVEY